MSLILQKLSPLGIFLGFGVLVILCTVSSVYLGTDLPLFLPLAAVALFLTLVGFRWLFFLLFALIPVSTELYFSGGFGTDFPSEPLMVWLMLFGLLFFVANPKKIERSFWQHPLVVLIFLHFLWIGISGIFSGIFYISLKYFLAKSWYLFVFTLLGAFFIKDVASFKRVFWYLLIPLLLAVCWVLYKHAQYGFDFYYVNKTMGPFFRNHVNYAVMLVMVLPFLLVMRGWHEKNRIPRMLINLGIFLFTAGIIFSYTRAAYVSLMIIPFGYYLFKHKLSKPAIISLFAGLVLLLGVLIQDNKYMDFAPDYTHTIYHGNFNDHLSATFELKDVSTMERVYRWIAAVNMSNEHVVAGFGPGTFYHFYKPYANKNFETYVSDNEDKSTVHNYFLLVLVEQGWIGLIIFLSLCIAIFVMGERIYHETKDTMRKQLVMAILISCLIVMANLFMADLLEVDKIGAIFFLSLALLVNQDIHNQKQLNEEVHVA